MYYTVPKKLAENSFVKVALSKRKEMKRRIAGHIHLSIVFQELNGEPMMSSRMIAS
jgi:hypothetical protein